MGFHSDTERDTRSEGKRKYLSLLLSARFLPDRALQVTILLKIQADQLGMRGWRSGALDCACCARWYTRPLRGGDVVGDMLRERSYQ